MEASMSLTTMPMWLILVMGAFMACRAPSRGARMSRGKEGGKMGEGPSRGETKRPARPPARRLELARRGPGGLLAGGGGLENETSAGFAPHPEARALADGAREDFP